MTGTLFTAPRYIPVNNAGLPRAGAQLYFYQAGTDVPVAVYTTAMLNVPHPVPVRASAGGEFSAIYLDMNAGYDYKAVLLTSTGVQVWVEDNIPSINTGIERTAEEIYAGVVPVDTSRVPGDPRRYGAIPDGSTNCDVSFTNAIAVASVSGGTIVAPAGTCLLTTEKVIASDHVFIRGEGPGLSMIEFNPATAAVCFNFDNGSSSMVQAGISGVGFTSSNSIGKTAVKIRDGRHFVIEDVSISQGAWLGATSTGLHVLGRDTLSATRLTILCARPILLSKNPNYPHLDTDHFHFMDCELGSTATSGNVIEVEDGVVITNLSFDGYQAWELGKYGLYWNDTGAATLDSYGLNITGVRTEQGTDATGYSIFLASVNNDLKSVHFESCYFDSVRNGVWMRRPELVSFQDCFFAAETGYTDLNIVFQDRTGLSLRNTFTLGTATLTLTNAVLLLESPWISSVTACAENSEWRFDEGGLSSRKARREDGVLSFKWKGTMATDSQINLPVLMSTGADVAHIRIAAGSATGPLLEGGGAIWRPGTIKLTGVSANVTTTSTASHLCIIDDTNGLAIINKLGQTADIALDVVWSD